MKTSGSFFMVAIGLIILWWLLKDNKGACLMGFFKCVSTQGGNVIAGAGPNVPSTGVGKTQSGVPIVS